MIRMETAGLGRRIVTDAHGRQRCPTCDSVNPAKPGPNCSDRWHRLHGYIRYEQIVRPVIALAVVTLLALILAVIALGAAL